MILLDPKKLDPTGLDDATRALLEKVVGFFESKGKARIKADYHAKGWYQDFLDFVRDERVFATLCTPATAGGDGARWDTARISRFAEILGFYGLQYWYTWQVSVLGLGPIWMSANDAVKQATRERLEAGGIFAFGLSERAHGADIYSTGMSLVPQGDGTYRARGGKYYIGNGNEAAFVSVFGKLGEPGSAPAAGAGRGPAHADGREYVFFVVEPRHAAYELVQNVVASQSYVSEFRLNDYPIREEDVLHRGQDAWDAALNTVNVGKYNLAWASIGISTHAFYEAIRHASGRRLYGMCVTDFSHVRRMFVEGYARLAAMKLFALRASDYMRVASAEDRRYLLYNPIMKMKVTTQGEQVIDLLWDVIAAKGFEKDMYFEQAAIDIRALPKLEGTVHVNIALIIKFMANYFFNPAPFDDVPRQLDARDDAFLFAQGSTRGLGRIQFHDPEPVYAAFDHIPNVKLFREQIAGFKTLLMSAPPNAEQAKDVDFLLTGGEIFALVVYGQLILENARLLGVSDDLVDQMFATFVADVSGFALDLHAKPSSTPEQMELALALIRKPAHDPRRYDAIWAEVAAHHDTYEMNP